MSDSKPQRPRQGPLRSLAWVRTPHILAFSSVIHLGLLIYAQHVDTHPEAYGGLKYTDVDWRVVVDGARHIWRPTGKGDVADGLVGRYLNERGLRIGDPYHRATFRYTPLLPLILSPALIHDLFGKVILSLISLAVPLVLLACRPTPLTSTPGASPGTPQKTDQRSPYFWPVHLLWTLNPFVLNITTRGSPEAIIILIVVACFAYLRPERGSAVAPRGKDEMAAAALFALAVSFKIYPIIYTPAIWSALSRRHGWLGYGVCRFGVVAASTMLVLNGALWLIWGQPFLEHTYLYHLSRLDHRHNFSPYFYGIYLSMLPPSSPLTSSGLSSFAAPVLPYLTTALQAIRHPLISFLPQATLVLALGWSMEPMLGLERTAFLQTAAFVVFNKVCTSQYFVWFIPLIPALIAEGGPLASASLASTLDATRARVADGRGAVESQLPRQHLARLAMSRRKAGILVAAWITGQAAWLGSAYRLELLAQDAYLQVWASGIALFGVSVWILGQLLDSVNFAPVAHPKTE